MKLSGMYECSVSLMTQKHKHETLAVGVESYVNSEVNRLNNLHDQADREGRDDLRANFEAHNMTLELNLNDLRVGLDQSQEQAARLCQHVDDTTKGNSSGTERSSRQGRLVDRTAEEHPRTN